MRNPIDTRQLCYCATGSEPHPAPPAVDCYCDGVCRDDCPCHVDTDDEEGRCVNLDIDHLRHCEGHGLPMGEMSDAQLAWWAERLRAEL